MRRGLKEKIKKINREGVKKGVTRECNTQYEGVKSNTL